MTWAKIKKHLLTGVSYMIPLVVASGICLAISTLLGGVDVAKATGTIPYYIHQIGVLGIGLVVPVITAYVAFSIADRPAIAPGFIAGLVCTDIKAGFLGGIVAAFLVGYTIIFLKKYVKVPKAWQGIYTVMLLPVVTTLFVGLVFYLFIGTPIAWAQNAIVKGMESMQGASRMVLGAIIGAMMGFDLGGPVNKTASLFADAMLTAKVYGPNAAKIIGGMTPPIGIALAALIARRRKFTGDEMEAAKAAFPLGLFFITEGALPFAMSDPVRVIPATMAGSAVAGGLSMLWNVTCSVPHGGILVVPLMGNPLLFLLALAIGSCVTAAVLIALKPRIKAGEEKTEAEAELKDADLKLNF